MNQEQFVNAVSEFVWGDKNAWKPPKSYSLKTLFEAIKQMHVEIKRLSEVKEINLKTLTIKIDASELATQLDRITESLKGNHDSTYSVIDAVKESIKHEVK